MRQWCVSENPASPHPEAESPQLIQPIQTWYAGCKFRSRLEARWAVFFDHLSLEWRYEPETYLVGGAAYLPDFWLPGLNRWVEVKGVLSQFDLDRLIAAADPLTGLPADPSGTVWTRTNSQGRILLLGDIPHAKTSACVHTRIDFCNGQVEIKSFVMNVRAGLHVYDWPVSEGLPVDGVDSPSASVYGPMWLSGYADELIRISPEIKAAYLAARSARFEHNESGALALPSPPPLSTSDRPVASRGRNGTKISDGPTLTAVPQEVPRPRRRAPKKAGPTMPKMLEPMPADWTLADEQSDFRPMNACPPDDMLLRPIPKEASRRLRR